MVYPLEKQFGSEKVTYCISPTYDIGKTVKTMEESGCQGLENRDNEEVAHRDFLQL